MGAKQIIENRASTHGDYAEVSRTAQMIKAAISRNLPDYQREALDLIATKIARISCGNNDEPDHWIDIEGYARPVRERVP